ncbi:glycosyltransferase [Pseudomonas prosekii]|uniref:glycosyltransferase n=1 Tax=Pseudomonas prosekii TaxID=1148509 RepID=UPI0015E81EC8|nr:glycosyltransferase [Pseudomonas prosekii]
MKVLLVNYYYKPMVDAHAYRWAQLAEYWAARGFEVDVICSKVSGAPSAERVNNVNVTRVGFFQAKKIQSEQNLNSQSAEKYTSVLAVLKKNARLLYRKIYWPDGLWHWSFGVANELFKRRSVPYDLVVSYSPSFAAHLSVLFFKKLCRRQFHWVADYGDPFSTSMSMPNNNIFLYRRLNHYVESSILNSASKACFTSQHTYDDYSSTFGVMRNAHVIPHLADIKNVYLNTKDVSDPIVTRLVFVGNFHDGIREPFLAAAIIEKLSALLSVGNGRRIVFDIYGASNGVDVASVCNSTIKWHGPLERERVAEVIGGADFLVNIENTNCSMIPSKIVEYIATGKPIIDIASARADVSALIARYAIEGHAVIMTAEDFGRLDCLENFIEKYKGEGKICFEIVSGFLKDYGIEAVSEKYLSDLRGAGIRVCA